MAASGKVSLRTLQEWMGHKHISTTERYADYMPGERESELIDDAFAPRTNPRPILEKNPSQTPWSACKHSMPTGRNSWLSAQSRTGYSLYPCKSGLAVRRDPRPTRSSEPHPWTLDRGR